MAIQGEMHLSRFRNLRYRPAIYSCGEAAHWTNLKAVQWFDHSDCGISLISFNLTMQSDVTYTAYKKSINQFFETSDHLQVAVTGSSIP